MEAVRDAAGRACLFLLANDAGNAAKRETGHLAEGRGKPLVILPYDKEALGRAAGRKTCSVAALINEEFSRGIREAINGGT
jgi:ribosomal protein L7Ae-like RNA K-turn-binding protein